MKKKTQNYHEFDRVQKSHIRSNIRVYLGLNI